MERSPEKGGMQGATEVKAYGIVGPPFLNAPARVAHWGKGLIGGGHS